MVPATHRRWAVGLPVRSLPSYAGCPRQAGSKDSFTACAPDKRLLVSLLLPRVNVFFGGKMTRGEEAAVLELWSRWFQDKPRSNQSYVDFYFDVIQPHRLLGRINAFEILDVLVNTESLSEQAQRQAPEDAESATEAV